MPGVCEIGVGQSGLPWDSLMRGLDIWDESESQSLEHS
jgi:hypothetical protein